MPSEKSTGVTAVRVLPMSDRTKGFTGRSIADVQERTFLRELPRRDGRFSYPTAGLNAAPGTVVLFQFKARVIASASFLSDEKFDHPRNGFAGVMRFEPASIRVFDPVDAATMRLIWPAFRNFGHVKQPLHPGHYPRFRRRLKNVRSPSF